MFPVGDWTSGNNYGFLDITYFGGSSYIAKTDIANSTVDPATDTSNWQILAHGYLADTLSGINGTDTKGLLGAVGSTVTGQALIDEIADRVSTKLLPYTHLINNGTTTVSGQYALDGAYGKTLADGLATANSNLSNKADKSDFVLKGSDIFIRKGNIVEANIINSWLNQRSVPNGYRPAGLRHFLLWDSTANAVADVYYDGTTNKFVSVDHNFAGTMVWITTDPMPS